MLALPLMLSACKKEVSNVIATEETSEDSNIIIDDSERVIPGEALNEEQSMLDVTELIKNDENYKETMDSEEIIDVEFYDTTSVVIVSQDKKNATVSARLYNPLEGKITANVSFTAKKNSEFDINVAMTGGKVYLEDYINKTFYVIAEDSREPQVYDYSDVDYSCKLNMSDGNGFYYIKNGDNDIYAYGFESGTSTMEYELDDEIESPALYGLTEDNTTVLFEYTTKAGIPYYGFIDMHALTGNYIQKDMYALKICGNDYLVVRDKDKPYVNLYSKTKPREYVTFALDDTKELDNITADTTGRYLYSYVQNGEEGKGMLRLYDKEAAILFNEIELEKDIFDNIKNVSISNEEQMAVIEYDDNGESRILIWNIAIPADVIDMNGSNYFSSSVNNEL